MTEPDTGQLSGHAAYLAVPVATAGRPGPWPGVVLVHDALGLSDDMREQADWLAAAGYLVAVPDLYGGKGAIRCRDSEFFGWDLILTGRLYMNASILARRICLTRGSWRRRKCCSRNMAGQRVRLVRLVMVKRFSFCKAI